MKYTKPSIREIKKARIKISILNASLELIGQNSFDHVYVKQICNLVGISKVTFFKYFPQKEDILRYYYKVWSFHRAVELSKDHKSGLAGIRYLFDCVSLSYSKYPGVFLGLYGYLSKLGMPVRPFSLKIAERTLLYPEIENINEIDSLSLDQLFENFLLEAIFSKEITRTGNVKQLLHMLDTILYGTILTAHVKLSEPSPLLFKQNLEMFLESLCVTDFSSPQVY
ncbi:MAG: TetR/AcrR family transcriptional regulator [Bacteroidetes bacterium]|nr:TetR/AcrR family transcriptional regulator [Bacteroidota bacterium]MCH8232404.1 TetR/AcrR family transcriptional regulator [Bacteroidota bacterium]